jgi:hypothetical protein
VVTLSHLFGRIPCHLYNNKTWLETVVRPSSSVVILPDLEPRATEILKRHNDETRDIFHTYVRSYIEQHLDKPDNELPLTKQTVSPLRPADFASITSPMSPTISRSPFSALSGHGDEYSTIHELCESVRGGVFLEEKAIPYIRIAPHETGGVPWNAYLLDFFKHGDLGGLKRDNGIKAGEVWFLLQNFTTILKTIKTSLENVMSAAEAELEENDCSEHEEDAIEDTIPLKKAAPLPSITKTLKKLRVDTDDESEEVADDWENEADSSDSDAPVSDSDKMPIFDTKGPQSLIKVHEAFSTLLDEFETKFRKVWA